MTRNRKFGWAIIAAVVLLAGTVSANPPGVQEDEAKSDETLAKQSDMILGLDGVAYRPYKKSVVEWVQKKLKDLEIYEGKIGGELNDKTMHAIAEFQKQHKIHASGIPSPLTRKALRGEMAENESDENEETSKSEGAS